jgi:dihydrofolate reductase
VSAAAPHSIAIVLVVAVADNGVIGRDNTMPWRLSSDLKRFKALTMGKPVLMGRKTFLSIGKPQCMPLADRLEVTHVHARPEGDTYFPPIDMSQWRAVSRSEYPAGPRDEASFACVSYVRS